MTPNERYKYDPLFKALVDMLHFHIKEARYTPTEIREAAMLAQIHYESYSIKSFITKEGKDVFNR